MSTTAHRRTARKEHYPRLNNHERRHVGVLHRRLTYLREKLASGDHSEEAGSFIASEISSLEWALERAVGILPETHMVGNVSVENRDLIWDMLFNRTADFGIQTHVDGRVWICINGVAWIRFKPLLKEITDALD